MAEKFEALEQQLELFIENTRQLAIIVGDFQPQGQSVLNQKLWVYCDFWGLYKRAPHRHGFAECGR